MTEDEFDQEKAENLQEEPAVNEETGESTEISEPAEPVEGTEISEVAESVENAEASEPIEDAEPVENENVSGPAIEVEEENYAAEDPFAGEEAEFETGEPDFGEADAYPSAPETAETEKKRLPTWLVVVITAVLTCAVMLIAFAALLLGQNVKPKARTVISYVESDEKGDTATHTGDVGAAVDKCMPALVSLSGTLEYESFFGISTQKVSGTGMVVSEDGYILTSGSLVGSKGEIKVKIGDKTYDAKVIGQDASKDLAIIKVEAEGLTAVTFGDSAGVNVGDSVIAIADVFGGEIGLSTSSGIICGINNGVSLSNGSKINLLQTDAAPGNSCSGGCLLDINGNVIGMLTNSISANSDKISFAIPSADIRTVMESIINTGSAPESLIIGIKGTDTDHGVTVESVAENSPAEAAGVKQGDLILKVDGKTVKTIDEINRIRDTHKKGDTITLTVYREGEMLKIDIKL